MRLRPLRQMAQKASMDTIDASLSGTADAGRLSQAWYARNDAWMTDSDHIKWKPIADLLRIKHHYFSLDLFNADEVDVSIDYLYVLRSSYSFLSYFFIFFLFIVFLLCSVV